MGCIREGYDGRNGTIIINAVSSMGSCTAMQTIHEPLLSNVSRCSVTAWDSRYPSGDLDRPPVACAGATPDPGRCHGSQNEKVKENTDNCRFNRALHRTVPDS